MVLFRSISHREFDVLLKGKQVQGRYDFKNEKQSTFNGINAISFFRDKIFWKDSKHSIFIKVDIPESELMFANGIYYAPKRLKQTGIWSGRTGKVKYVFEEAYANHYDISNITDIYIGDIFANWYLEKEIYPAIEKYNNKINLVNNLDEIKDNGGK